MNPADLGQPQTTNLIGATIGNYRIISKLGEGGMGSVYLGEHPLIGKKVAVKVLHDEFVSNPDVVTRFFNEAKAVNDIGHPNIVDIIDFGQVQNGNNNLVYFIMEYLNGESLAQLLARESPIPPARALHILMQIADCLRASHAKGIIHRDIKPDNIYLVPRGADRDFVKVLDFGIAKLTGDTAGSRKTRTGIVMGTPAYMSPEQCEGRGNIDHRTDIYAVGVVSYEILTGRVPFLGEGYGEVLVQHLTKVPERPSTIRGAIPPAIEGIVMKMLEKRREDRFQSMDQLMEALQRPDTFAAGPPMQMPAALTGMNQGATVMLSATPHPTGLDIPMHHGGGALPTMSGAKRPTTLGEGTGEVLPEQYGAPRSASSKKGLFMAAAAVVVLGGGLVAYLASRGGDKKHPQQAAAGDPGQQGTVPNDTTPPAPSDKGANPPVDKVTPPPVDKVTPPPVDKVTPPPVDKPVDKVTPPPAPVKVTVTITSSQSNADVWLGDKRLGPTPYAYVVDKGSAKTELTVKAIGFEPEQRSIGSDKDEKLAFDLKPVPPPVVKPVAVIKPPHVSKPPHVAKPVVKPVVKPVTKPGKPGKKPDDQDGVLAPSFK